MRLFSLPDGTVDRKDRAAWLTQPFDRAYGNSTPPPTPTPTSAFRKARIRIKRRG